VIHGPLYHLGSVEVVSEVVRTRGSEMEVFSGLRTFLLLALGIRAFPLLSGCLARGLSV
jgi:hypothetical protein